MYKYYIYILIFIVFVTFPVTVMAETTTTYPALRANLGKNADKMATGAAQNKADNLQTRATNEITRRITALQELLTRLTNLKKVSSATKTTLSTQIQTEINNLTALQTKIQQETDVATIRADVQSIVTQHRVFAVFMPQVRLLGAADALTTAVAQFTVFSEKLSARITQAKTEGNDTSAQEAQLADMNAKIQDAQKQATDIIAAVSPLTPAGYPSNKSVLTTAQTNLKTGIQDLKSARQTAQQIIQSLKIMKASTPSGTIILPSPTGSTSATPTL